MIDKPSCGDHDHLALWVRLGSIAISAASVVRTRHRWAEGFIHWSQRSGSRIPLMESTTKCSWSRRAFFGRLQLWVHLNRDRLRQVYLFKTHEKILLWLLIQICGKNWSIIHLHSDRMNTLSYSTDVDDEEL